MEIKDFQNLMDKAESLIRDVRDRWEDEEVQERIQNCSEKARKLVYNYPVGSLVGAIVTGYVMGKLLRKKD